MFTTMDAHTTHVAQSARWELYISYNPMSTVQSGRWEEIHSFYSSAHVVALQGTRRKLTSEHHFQLVHNSGFFIFDAGYGCHSNKHAGVSIAFNKKFFHTNDIHAVAFPSDPCLQGRAIAVRARRQGRDITFISAYFPPSGTATATTDKLYNWLLNFLWDIPIRTCPILFLDANAKVGIPPRQLIRGITGNCETSGTTGNYETSGTQETVRPDTDGLMHSQNIGKYNADHENHNGTIFRQLLCKTNLCATNTFRSNSPTFYSGTNNCSSRVDYICCPISTFLHGYATAAVVRSRDGRKLQLVNTVKRIDHEPLGIYVLASQLIQYVPPPAYDNWDFEKLVANIVKGERRQEFFDALKIAIEKRREEWSNCTDSPSSIYDIIKDTIRDAALPLFLKDTSNVPSTLLDSRKDLLKQRANFRNSCNTLWITATSSDVHLSTYLSTIFKSWLCIIQVAKISRHIKAIKRNLYDEAQENRRIELQHAWRTRDLALAWKLTRLISGSKKGPRRRWGNICPTANPTRQQWINKITAPACQGGWQATILQEAEVTEPPIPAYYSDMNDTVNAKNDFHELKWMVRAMKCRKGTPVGDIPAELWRIIFWPQLLFKDLHKGIGATKGFQSDSDINSWVFKLLTHIRASSRAPIQFSTSRGHKVLKKAASHTIADYEDLTGDTRIVHTFPSIAKAFYKVIANRAHDVIHPLYQHGAIPGRRREAAIATQQIMAMRYSMAHISHIKQFFDTRNAFPSPDFDTIHSVLCEDYGTSTYEQRLLQQHVEEHICMFQALDGDIVAQMGSGIPQGCTTASLLFNRVYKRSANHFLTCTRDADVYAYAVSPITGNMVQTSTTIFVDDIGKTSAIGDISQLCNYITALNSDLDDSLSITGCTQNTNKQEFVARLFGPGSFPITRQLQERFPQSFRTSARYLGPMLSWNSGATVEVDRRCKSARAAWFIFRKFWFSRNDTRFILLVFRAVIFSILTSGLTAFVLSVKDLNKLNTVVIQCGRKLMKGKACTKTDDGKGGTTYKNVTNDKVLKFIGLTDVGSELHIARLRWYQSIAKDPTSNDQFLTALLAIFPFEALPAPCHPWYTQFSNDLKIIEEFDDIAWIYEQVATAPTLIFTDLNIREAFVAFDFSQIRARFLSVQIPPPGYGFHTCAHTIKLMDVIENKFTCKLTLSDGQHCNMTFNSAHALAGHQLRSTIHHSSIRLSALIPFNICPWCSTSFRSHAATLAHVHNAFVSGTCNTDRTWHVADDNDIEGTFTCLLCHTTIQGSSQYCWHLRQHISPTSLVLHQDGVGHATSLKRVQHRQDTKTGSRRIKARRPTIAKDDDRCGETLFVFCTNPSSNQTDIDENFSDFGRRSFLVGNARGSEDLCDRSQTGADELFVELGSTSGDICCHGSATSSHIQCLCARCAGTARHIGGAAKGGSEGPSGSSKGSSDGDKFTHLQKGQMGHGGILGETHASCQSFRQEAQEARDLLGSRFASSECLECNSPRVEPDRSDVQGIDGAGSKVSIGTVGADILGHGRREDQGGRPVNPNASSSRHGDHIEAAMMMLLREQLQVLCSERGLPTWGSKLKLIGRLRMHHGIRTHQQLHPSTVTQVTVEHGDTGNCGTGD